MNNEEYFKSLKMLYIKTMNKDVLNFWLYSQAHNLPLTLTDNTKDLTL